MDVVRANVEGHGGNVHLESATGAGTTVRLTLPLTLAILPALQLGTDPTDTVPPTLVTFDPRLLALSLVAVALGMLVAGRLIGRLGARVDLIRELRSLG